MAIDKNEALLSLYSKLDISKITDEYNSKTTDETHKTACPLFIKTNPGYEKADIKLMIFGQETNGWGDGIYSKEIAVERIMENYEGFFSGKSCYTYGGQFWNGVKHFVNKLQQKSGNNTVDYLWNNIVKMGYNGKGFPYDFYNNTVKSNFSELINKEIDILKPDYIIFFTGPTYEYENALDDVFKNSQRKAVSGFELRELCEIAIPNAKKAFRTYHPTYLYHEGLSEMDRYYDRIIEEILKEDFNKN